MNKTPLQYAELIAAEIGSTVRPTQVAAFNEIAKGHQHTAIRAGTGSGKSLIAAAVAAAAPGGAMIAVFSNGLISQYLQDVPLWTKATGKSFAPLVGSAHYHCKVAAPDLSFLAPKVRKHVEETGMFVGSGLAQSEYVAYSVKAVSGPADPNAKADDDGTTAKTSPCTACVHKSNGCPLWRARFNAASADVVITNVTLAALAMSASGGPQENWLSMIDRPLTLIDEAHAAAEPIQSILGQSVTISRRTADREMAEAAAESVTAAMKIIRDVAYAESTPNMGQRQVDLRNHSQDFLKALGDRTPLFDGDAAKPKATLIVPVSLREFFADRQVIAMSGTLNDHYTRQLGLTADCVELQGLDVSASMVIEQDFLQWAYPAKGNADAVAKHKLWAATVAVGVESALDNGGRTILICQSGVDLDAIIAALPAAKRPQILVYKSGVDRMKVVETYKAAPQNYVMAGFSAGAGTGLNLPDDLVRTIIVCRVPQSPPMGADRIRFFQDSCSAVCQSVGRGHRNETDWAHVYVLGGFGKRDDIRTALKSDGWVIQ